MVSVNTYGIVENVTFPLLFRVFKPQKRLKPADTYRSKPQIALELVDSVQSSGFKVDLVLADRLYGESGEFIRGLLDRQLQFVVAIRDNHAVWLPAEARIRWTRCRPFQRVFVSGKEETRFICELIYGKRGIIRYFQLTTDPLTLPTDSTYLLMTNLTGNLRHTLGNHYGLRTWIEYGFKQIKNELGWADYRLTDYAAIERWWELVLSAYLVVSLQTDVFQNLASPDMEHRASVLPPMFRRTDPVARFGPGAH